MFFSYSEEDLKKAPPDARARSTRAPLHPLSDPSNRLRKKQCASHVAPQVFLLIRYGVPGGSWGVPGISWAFLGVPDGVPGVPWGRFCLILIRPH